MYVFLNRRYIEKSTQVTLPDPSLGLFAQFGP